MRHLILLLFIGFVFATPEISSVHNHNTNLGSYLENNFNQSASESGSLQLFGQSLPLFASIEIINPTLLVDNLTHPIDDLGILFSRGYYLSHLNSSGGQACNEGYHPVPECDLDADGCFEYETNTSVSYDSVNITFNFHNTSATVPFSSTVLDLPPEILDAMLHGSGLDNLGVFVQGNVVFSYFINDNEFDGFGCNDNISQITYSIPFSLNQSFQVAGSDKIFFLTKPVLREQLANNNHFDFILLSQSPVYQIQLFMDGNLSKNLTLRNFSTGTGQYTTQTISSYYLDTSNIAEYGPNLSTPIPLEKQNNSFAYIYQFNSTYIGVGKHNFSLIVIDSFLETVQYNETITSRVLSNLNQTSGSDIYRPNVISPTENLIHIQLSIGFVMFIIFLAFVYFWVK